MLKPNGHLFITTGDIDSKLAKSQGSRWRMIHPPSHLQYFSKNTLTKLLNSKGFEVIDVKYPGYWRSLGQILHGLFILGSNDKESIMYILLRIVVPKRFGLYLNTYDIMLVTAKLTGKKLYIFDRVSAAFSIRQPDLLIRKYPNFCNKCLYTTSFLTTAQYHATTDSG